MSPHPDLRHAEAAHRTRRHFLRDCSTGLGAIFLQQTLGRAFGATGLAPARDPRTPLASMAPHFAPKAKRVIYLHMAGAPSQLELFDHKPDLAKLDGQPCPKEFLEGKQFAFITGVPLMMGPKADFTPAGQRGMMVSQYVPHLRGVIDELCFVHSMQTEQFNHAPAQLLLLTGNANLGYASLGAWATYGLGTENENLPGFIVLVSGGQSPDAGKGAWGSGFLPSIYQGVQCRSQGDPVLYLSNPAGISRSERRRALDALNEINRRAFEENGDPEVLTRVAQYEMAFRMQMSAADAMDIRQEPPQVLAHYGAQPGQESFANNCLLARRLAERGVRFIQLHDWGWDQHGTDANTSVDQGMARKCGQTDQAVAALLGDLRQRGLLDETLVVWGGEFGRTPMKENRAGSQNAFHGRDHHKDAFTIWMAGGGTKPGINYGLTDPVGYSVAKDPVLVRDLHATILHLLGFDHHKLSVPFQGLDQRITGVKPCRVVRELVG